MKKKIIIGSIVGAFCILIVTGFLFDTESQIRQYGLNTVTDIGRNDVKFNRVVQVTDDMLGEVFEGGYEYCDSNYIYIVEPMNDYVQAIFPSTGRNESYAISASEVFLLSTQDDVIRLFQANMEEYLVGEINCSKDDAGEMLIYTINERIDGIGTGTSASIIVDAETGALLSASFIKGDAESVLELNRDEMITSEEALQLAVDEILLRNTSILSLNVVGGEKKYQAEICTFKGNTFWRMEFDVIETMVDGGSRDNHYIVRVEVNNGEILEIAQAY